MLQKRYRQITFFFARTLLSLAFWEILLPRLGMRKFSAANRSARLQRFGVQYRILATRLGGVLIKVGQFLSARVDVLPIEITAELSGLQDEVTPEAFVDISRVAEAEFGVPLLEKYDWFDEQPLAAASLGQVHTAKLRSTTSIPLQANENAPKNVQMAEYIDVVVKIQRPNIEQIIATDLAALQTVGKWVRRYPPIRKRANVTALLEEFTRTLYEEIDYLAEGRNAETFAANFKDHPNVLVPKVYWTHTSKRVLTLENVRGIKITDYEAISGAGIGRAEVASLLLDTYLKQIFQDGFFHADPHPGNLFVRVHPPNQENIEPPISWQLTFVDFGMVGRILPQTRMGMRELLIGVGTRDTARINKAYQMLGFLLPGADLELIEQAEEAVFSRFWGKSMSEMTQFSVDEMHEFAYEFRDIIYDMPFQIPQDIIFLARAVSILSGMCTGLNPDFNIWTHVAPFSKQLIAEEISGQRKNWIDELGTTARKIFTYPARIESILGKIEHGKLVTKDPELASEVRRLGLAVRQLSGILLFAVFFLSSVVLFIQSAGWIAGLFGMVALITFVWVCSRF